MFQVTKANGQKEPFNEEKVIKSIIRARIPSGIQSQVLQHVKSKIYDGIPSQEIYHHILEFLGQSEHPFSRSRYSLKEAIMRLGPTGYPFEDFISEILQTLGYETKVRQIIMGKCVSHEIDVVAKKDNKTSIIEAKFHNSVGTRSDVHVALYTHARFLDIKAKNPIDECWIMTNTKTTSDANIYADCVGLKVISWSYPDEGSLRDLIEKSRLHPVTMLSSLSQTAKDNLLENHIVLCKSLQENPQLLETLPISSKEREDAKTEIAFVCNTDNH